MGNNVQKIFRYPNRLPLKNVAELKKIIGKGKIGSTDTDTDYDYAILLGKDEVNDGFAREYYWNNGSRDPGDDDKVVVPNKIVPVIQPGRWILVEKNSAIPRSYFTQFTVQSGSPQSVWRFTHNLGTRNLIVQVTEVNPSPSEGDVDVEVKIVRGDDYIEIQFITISDNYNNPTYNVLAIEVLTT